MFLRVKVTLEAWEKLRGKDRVLDKNALQQELDRHELQNLKLMACFAGIDRAAFDQKRSWMRDEFIQHLCAFLVSEVDPCLFHGRCCFFGSECLDCARSSSALVLWKQGGLVLFAAR